MTTMALFINTGEHPSVFGSEKDITSKNQSFYRKDHVSELIKEQEKVNGKLLRSLSELTTMHHKQVVRQDEKWQKTEYLFEELQTQQNLQRAFESHTRTSLKELYEQNEILQTMMEKERQQLSTLHEANQDTASLLQKYEAFNEQMTNQMDHMLQLQTDAGQKIMEQEHQRHQLNDRLENQEALTEKALRQLDQLRAALFERTNHILEKVEDGYQLTSSYMYQLLKGSNQPFTFFISEDKNEDKNR